LKILTVFKPSSQYNESHVDRLTKHVKKYSGYDLTVIEGRYPIWYEGKYGCWLKMDIFKEHGPCLYMDLDTTIVDDISELLAEVEKHDFIAMRDFNHWENIGGMLLSWKGDVSHLTNTFEENAETHMKQYKSDQTWLDDHVDPIYWQDILPNRVLSYKKYVKENGIHEKCRIVAFHGNPRPWAINELVKEEMK